MIIATVFLTRSPTITDKPAQCFRKRRTLIGFNM